MKNKLKIVGAIAVIGLSIGEVNAITKSPALSISETKSNEWILVQNENGVKTFFSIIEEGEKSFLKIKFENSMQTDIDIRWSLSNKIKSVLENQSNKIEANESIEIYDATMLVEINSGESIEDFSISTNLK